MKKTGQQSLQLAWVQYLIENNNNPYRAEEALIRDYNDLEVVRGNPSFGIIPVHEIDNKITSLRDILTNYKRMQCY